MSGLIIVCRHGNTFEKGEKVVMVGAREDLPLTEHGREQARRMAQALTSLGVKLDRVVSGPLQRTREFAEIVICATGSAVKAAIEQRLLELDYGAWGGKSNEEIEAAYGAEALQAWQERSIRPAQVDFQPSEETLEQETRELLAEWAQHSGVLLVVTSNGRLRELGRVVQAPSAGSFKVRTGHACVLRFDNGGWQIVGWDLPPEALVKAF